MVAQGQGGAWARARASPSPPPAIPSSSSAPVGRAGGHQGVHGQWRSRVVGKQAQRRRHAWRNGVSGGPPVVGPLGMAQQGLRRDVGWAAGWAGGGRCMGGRAR